MTSVYQLTPTDHIYVEVNFVRIQNQMQIFMKSSGGHNMSHWVKNTDWRLNTDSKTVVYNDGSYDVHGSYRVHGSHDVHGSYDVHHWKYNLRFTYLEQRGDGESCDGSVGVGHQPLHVVVALGHTML